MWKNMSTIFFAPKVNSLWLLLCHRFWGPLELYSYSKMAKNLDSWPLDIPQKSEHLVNLKLNTCPVPIIHICSEQIDSIKLSFFSVFWYRESNNGLRKFTWRAAIILNHAFVFSVTLCYSVALLLLIQMRAFAITHLN